MTQNDDMEWVTTRDYIRSFLSISFKIILFIVIIAGLMVLYFDMFFMCYSDTEGYTSYLDLPNGNYSCLICGTGLSKQQGENYFINNCATLDLYEREFYEVDKIGTIKEFFGVE